MMQTYERNSRIIKTYFQGVWHDGNHPIMGAADQATWLGTLVFDGARRFLGVTPDLQLHCHRIIRSAHAMGLKPSITGDDIYQLACDGLKLIPSNHDLYIRPMLWGLECGPGLIEPVVDQVGFALCLEEMPMPIEMVIGKLALSPYRRPTLETALVNAKAASLYANSGRIIAEARARGFHNAIVLDANGNVAETGSSNLFLVKDGIIKTPIPNGTFLAGITRSRVMELLKGVGHVVQELTLTLKDFREADEIFMTANYSKVVPVSHFEAIEYQIGPLASLARKLYWDWSLNADKA